MSTGFVYLRPLPVVCARALGPYGISAPIAWRQIFAWLDDSGNRLEVGCGYGMMRDNPALVEDEQCRYDACVPLIAGFENTVPAGFRITRLPGGAYARKRQFGMESIHHTVAALRDEFVPAKGLAIDTRRPFVEIYLDDPARVPEEKRRVDVCIPVSANAAGHRSAA